MSYTWLRPWTKRGPQTVKKGVRRRTRRLLARPGVELLEQRLVLDYRTITGFGNNLANPTWGEAGTHLIRISPAAYADGISAPALPNAPSARTISNLLNDQTDPNNPDQDLVTVNSKSLSDFAYVWGQFLDHDLDLTPDGGESFPIPVDPGDPIGPDPLPFTRSQFDPNTGSGPDNPRQQISVVTSFEDLSQVYGSDNAKADALRTHVGGKLKTSPGNLLPYNNITYFTTPIDMANDAMQVPDDTLFAAGDRRANENIELTALQTLFVREHNRLADRLHALNPTWNDEQLYQKARKINIAESEIITYTEFLPAILGPKALPAYTGYKAGVNPSIANEFSTMAFRFGHSLLSGTVGRDQNNGLGIADVSPDGSGVDLSQDFFDPNLINPNGVVDPITGHTSSDIGAILKADADNVANETDLLAIRQIRNLLFGPEGAGGQDLIARDIQRGRDHGLPDYNTMRAAYGLPRVTSFAEITSDVNVQQELEQAYGSVDNIDAFEGALAEDHVPGANVGPLLKASLVDQFTRLRDGDRFFYLNERFSLPELFLLQGTTLAKVIERNTDITNLQSNAFFFKVSISGTVFLDLDGDGLPRIPGEEGLPGFTVQLNDASGNVIATTVTDDFGNYSFTEQTGIPGTGEFSVSLVLLPGFVQTSEDPPTFLISRGNIRRNDMSFGVNFASSGAASSLLFNPPEKANGLVSSIAPDQSVPADSSSPPVGAVAAIGTWSVHLPASDVVQGAVYSHTPSSAVVSPGDDILATEALFAQLQPAEKP